ncbi:3-dehydroquinate synthase [Sporosarcina pasteurii]|uniref:3-dehydroquinate synthase n=1 Tax=Sporosarcina pasteurii TaxID=1474 RepID=A0A380BK99_SPOPA|nr:3-dehydroquinate synthase [Sporosarcina pasteurii]MDS9470824.1 3-dehydroquinate synthase [Sporosarcina pasteurii]QBQ05509.1 3-dehydroquinate synthase [Sporosarcina pasteurii]SUJ02706.1 3-dehydroquinate synthase [Sporosarcina pasteurii]
MGKLTVETTNHRYDVLIGPTTYALFSTVYKDLLTSADRIAIIADEKVAAIHLPLLEESLAIVKDKLVVKTIPAGEACKSIATYADCQSFLLQQGFTRQSLIIAYGGGACGDLAGYVAATFMRGIRYIHCPTTILAHDSAVGGKTAINMPEGKNMVGAFHQPSAVLFQTGLFSSLPSQEVRSGLAELLKHAFISNEEWTMQLLANKSFTNPSEKWLTEELLKGIQVKAKIVAEDEFEQSTRKFLNFGHTFGHAVEAACGFGKLSHGESVMIGMIYSLQLSEMMGLTAKTLTEQLIQFANEHEYPLHSIHDFSFDEFMNYMQKDKKMSHGKLNFVLLKGIGQPFVTEVTREQCLRAFQELTTRTEGMS